MSWFATRSGPLGGHIPGLLCPPAPRLCRHAPLRFVVRQVRAGRRPIGASLSLVALMDVLIVLVLVLSHGFSAPPCDSSLLRARAPQARNLAELEAAPLLRISDREATLDWEPISSKGAGPGVPRLDLEKLRDHLAVRRDVFHLVHPSANFPGLVLLWASPRLPFGVLRQLLSSFHRVGYHRVHFLVEPAGQAL